MRSSFIIASLVAGAFAAPAFAQTAADHGAHHPSQVARATALTSGEVRKVDKDAGKITLKHGPITNLDMPAMTMAFRVSDAAFLDKVKAGDKVLFAADNTGGQLTVTRIERAP